MTAEQTNEPSTTARDWADKAADVVVGFADSLRTKGVDPIFKIVRLTSYGIIAALVGTVICIVLVTILVRILTDYVFGHHVWITYLVLGGISVTVGLFLLNRMKSYR